MKLEDLPDFMLGPLAGRDDDAWHRSPSGKWSPGEIVDHVATAIGNTAKGFESRLGKPAMERRPRSMPQRIEWMFVGGLGWFPVKRQAPEPTRPQARPDRAATEKKLREAVAAYVALRPTLAGRTDLYLKHPVFGDLTYDEFGHFHMRHVNHHRKQLVKRLGEQAF